MSEVVYEETATMIAAGELQSFVPFGREHCRNHPNAFNLQLRELQPASELWSSDGAAGLVGSLQEVSLQEREKVRLHGFYTLDLILLHKSTSVCKILSKINLIVVHNKEIQYKQVYLSLRFDWQECWQLRKGCMGVRQEDFEFEEELYTAGNVVVWSQGSRNQASSVYKAFTVDSPVQQVRY